MAPRPLAQTPEASAYKPCPFLTIPAELRINIYELVFDNFEFKLQDGLLDQENRGKPALDFKSPFPLALLRVSKKVREEARPIADKCPIFYSGFNGSREFDFLRDASPDWMERIVCITTIDLDTVQRLNSSDGLFCPALKLVQYGGGWCSHFNRILLIPAITYIIDVLSGVVPANESDILTAALGRRYSPNIDGIKSFIERTHVTVKIPCGLIQRSKIKSCDGVLFSVVAGGVVVWNMSGITLTNVRQICLIQDGTEIDLDNWRKTRRNEGRSDSD